jgi:hypothetical protein
VKARSIKEFGVLESMIEESRGLPPKLLKGLKTAPFVFVHSYPNLDRVLQGMDLLARAGLKNFHSAGVLIVDARGLTAGSHVFVGIPRLKGVGKAYVEKIEKGLAYIVGMGSELES